MEGDSTGQGDSSSTNTVEHEKRPVDSESLPSPSETLQDQDSPSPNISGEIPKLPAIPPTQIPAPEASKETLETESKKDAVFKSPLSITPIRSNVKKATGSTALAFGEKESEVIDQSVKKEEKSKEDVTKKETSEPLKKVSARFPSPAEQMKQQEAPIPYKEPSWGSICGKDYSFEVIKNGTVVDKLDLKTKSFYVFGRLPSCDITMEHPSLSRYHAVVQYCGVENDRQAIGWYLHDLDSTHGTWINKTKVKPRVFVRLRVGHVVKFGGSTRLNILQGPDEDQEEESDLTVTEIKEQRERQKKEAEVLRLAEIADAENEELRKMSSEDNGCSWGMDDHEPEEISSENPFALNVEPENEHLYIQDPKKALRGFFEREGHELPEYDVVEEGRGKYKCRVELPLFGQMGEPIHAEVTVTGKKKEAVASCALEACRILDRHGELRKATHEGRAKKKKNWEENDFYDSDEDTFLDRTGDIEKKRKMRMQREKKNEKAETYDSLINKLEELEKELKELEDKLKNDKEQASQLEDEGMDAFDAYMMALKSGALDTKTKTKIKRQIFDLKQEKQRLEKLANVAKPALPGIKKPSASLSKFGSLFGKMKGPAKFGTKPSKSFPKTEKPVVKEMDDKMEEEEEEDEEDDEKKKQNNVAIATIPSTESKEDSKSDKKQNRTEPAVTGTSDSCEKRILGPSKPPSSDIVMDDMVTKDSDRSTVESVTDVVEAEVEKSITVCEVDSNRSMESEDIIPQGAAPNTSSVEENVQQVSAPTSVVPLKKRKHKALYKKEKKTKSEEGSSYKAIGEDPDYDVWIRPKDQTGDGKTHLNAKFGY